MEIFNLKVNIMKTKYILLLILLLNLCFSVVAADRLGMFVDVKRYLDNDNNTKFVIDYQVPYKNLMFSPRSNGYFAELKVTIAIANEDSVIYTKEFTNNIGVSRKYDVTSSGKSYLDRITLTLAKSGFRLAIIFEDINALKMYEWNYLTEQLRDTDVISDLELVTSVSPDTNSFSQKYLRDGNIHLSEPSGIVAKELKDSVFFYFEVYGKREDNTNLVLTLKKDDIVTLIQTYPISELKTYPNLLIPVNITNMELGKYTASVSLSDQSLSAKSYEFIITEQAEKLYFIFTDAEEEYLLIRSLTPVMSKSAWKSMSNEAKRRYISNFWVNLAAVRNQAVEVILDMYKDRIDYCNARFSHFEKGWKTDMGRIYIRNGAPSDIEYDTSSDDTKFVRKDFQIWKYSGSFKAVYVFVDIPMNGNFKLIYADNDEQESTNPGWRKYLGTDFDEARLEN